MVYPHCSFSVAIVNVEYFRRQPFKRGVPWNPWNPHHWMTHSMSYSNTTVWRQDTTYFSKHVGSLLEVMTPSLLGASEEVFYQSYSNVIPPATRDRHTMTTITHTENVTCVWHACDTYVWRVFFMVSASLVPTLHVPPSEKQSGEQSQISWAYSLKTVEDQWDCEIANHYIALPLQH